MAGDSFGDAQVGLYADAGVERQYRLHRQHHQQAPQDLHFQPVQLQQHYGKERQPQQPQQHQPQQHQHQPQRRQQWQHDRPAQGGPQGGGGGKAEQGWGAGPRAQANGKALSRPAINKELIRAAEIGDLRHLLETVEAYLPQMNVVNLSTSLYRLGKLGASHPSTQAALCSDPVVRSVLEALIRRLRGTSPNPTLPQAISNVAWSLASLRHMDAPLLELLASQATSNMPSFKYYELSSLLWAFAKLGAGDILPPSTAMLFEAAAETLRGNLPEVQFRSLATIAWAFATAKIAHPLLFQDLSVEMCRKVRTANSQEIANSAWAFGTASYKDSQLMQALGDAGVSRLEEYKPQEISNTLWGFATAGFFHASFCARALALTSGMELNSQHLANILWAVARVRPKHTVTRAAAIRLLPRCTALLEQFKPQEASSVLLAASKIFGRSHPGGSEEGAAPPPAGQPGEHVQHPQEVLMFCECVERWASPRVRTFSDQSLTNILVALGTLGLSGRRALTPAVEQEVLERAPHLPAGRFIVLFRGLLSNPAVEPTVLQRAAGMMAEKFPLLPQDRWSLARVFSARRSTANMTEEQLLNWCLTMSTDLQVAVQQSACCGGGPPADDLGCEEPPGPSAGRPRYAAGETHFEGSDQQAAAFGGGGPPVADGLGHHACGGPACGAGGTLSQAAAFGGGGPPVADGLGHHACGGPACGAGGTLPQAGALHGGADFNGRDRCAQPSRGPPQQACFEAGRFGQPAAWAPGMSGPPYEREAWPPQQSAAHPAPQMPERHFGSRAPSGAHDGRFECEAWPPQRAPAEAPAWEDRAWPRSRADFRGPAESPPAHQAYQYHRSPAEDAFDDHSAAAHGAAVQASMPASSSSSSSRPRRGNGAPQWQHPDRGGPGGGALGHGDRRPRAAPGSWRQPEGAEAAAPAGAGGWRAEREAPQLPPPARGAGLRMEVRGGRWHPEEQAAGGGWRPGPPDDGEPPGWRPGARGGGWQLETAGDLGWQSAELVEDPEAIYGFSHGWGEVAARRGGPQGYPETWPEDASGGCHAGAQQGEPWPSGGGARGCPAPPAGDDDGAAAAGDAAESQVEHMEAQEFEVRNTFVEAASDREERALKSWAFNFNSAPPMKPAAVPAEGADRAAATAAGGEEAHVRRKAPTSLMPSSLRQRLKTTFMKLDEEKEQEQEDADAASVGNRSQASSTPAAGAGGDPAQS